MFFRALFYGRLVFTLAPPHALTHVSREQHAASIDRLVANYPTEKPNHGL